MLCYMYIYIYIYCVFGLVTLLINFDCYKSMRSDVHVLGMKCVAARLVPKDLNFQPDCD